MLSIVKEKIQNVRRPRIHNPFRLEEVGRGIYIRFDSMAPEEAADEFALLDDNAQTLYREYLSARDNRDIAKSVLGITALGVVVGGIVVAFTGDDEDDADYDDEDDDDEDDTLDDEDEDESSDS